MQKKWTILFIMHAIDSELTKHVNVLINILETMRWNSEESNVLYLKNAYSRREAGRKKRKIEAKLFQIVPAIEKDKFHSSELKNYGQINIGSTINLTAIFSEIHEQFPSERIMLYTWDHGSGFGVWEADPISVNAIKFNTLNELESFILNTESDEQPARFKVINNDIVNMENEAFRKKDQQKEGRDLFPEDFKNISFFGKVDRYIELAEVKEETDILTNEELAESIKQGFKGQKVDILIMVNCFMQMTETGFSLKDCVNYLVACETAFWAYGFDYASIFNRIITRPDSNSEDITKLFIETVENTYRRINKLQYLDDVVVSACDLSYAESLADAVNDMVKIINSDTATYYPLIKKARKDSTEISSLIFKKGEIPLPYPLFIIDLLYFVSLLADKNHKMKRLLKKLFDEVVNNKYIIARRVGSDFEMADINIEKVNGFSIYFPQNKKDIDRDYYRYFYKHNARFEIAFSRKTLWSQFIPVYLEFK